VVVKGAMAIYYELYAWLVHVQGGLQSMLAHQVRSIADSGRIAPSVALLAIGLGTLHALTPGHGKSVVVSYFLGRDARPLQGFAMAAQVALSHTLSAILLVLVFGGAVTLLGRPTGAAAILQTCSYGLIAVVGACYPYQAVSPGLAHVHKSSTLLLPYAVGVLPCPLTMLVVGHAMLLGAYPTGLALAGLMGAGAALTIGVFGTMGIILRRGLFGIIDPQVETMNLLLGVLEIASAVLILAIGLAFFAGSL
jgi:ABC-type nickel/cobalt efflux system permease component RcnA